MKKMKNLFEYATKELSQDAFLRWLFENYKCEKEKVREAAYKLLNEFCCLKMKDGDITDLKTCGQYKKIDVTVCFKYNDRCYLVAIEDKTFSNEHDQLKKYNDALENKENKYDICDKFELSDDEYNNLKIFKIFYKTDDDYFKEKDICEKNGWKHYFINDVSKLFSGISNTGSEILDDYIEHLAITSKKVNEVSDEPIKKWDYRNFRTYLHKVILPEAEKIFNGKKCKMTHVGWYAYASLEFKHNYDFYKVKPNKETEDKIIKKETENKITKKETELSMELKSYDTESKNSVTESKNSVTKSKNSDTGFKVTFRLKGKAKFEDDEIIDVECDPKLKDSFRNIITKSENFNKYSKKWCVSSSSKKLDEKFSNKNQLDIMTANIVAVIKELADIFDECEHIDGIK